MSRAENALTASAHAAADEIEALLTDVALGRHVGPGEDAKEAHRLYGRFVLLLFGRTFAIVHTTIVAHPPWPAGVNCGGVCEP